jgi:threonine aldolase
MGNQIAVHLHVRRGEEVILDADSHIADHEMGGIAAWTGAMGRLVRTSAGVPSAAQLEASYRGGEPYYTARTALVAIENTHMVSGGVPHAAALTAPVLAFARARGITAHLDGARIFNAAAARRPPRASLAAPSDSVMFCFSKGLGAPVGSCLAGSEDLIREARRVRKRLGGGMRQAGILAAGALHALRHHVDRLPEDHARARRLAEGIAGLPGLTVDPDPPPSNIVMVKIVGADPQRLCDLLAPEGVLVTTEGPKVRFVTHLDVDDAGIERTISAIRRVAPHLA